MRPTVIIDAIGTAATITTIIDRRVKAAVLFAALLPGLAGGCGTLGQHLASDGRPGPYSGVKADWEVITVPNPIVSLVGCCDLPLSFIADTLLLGYDLTHANLWRTPKPQPTPKLELSGPWAFR